MDVMRKMQVLSLTLDDITEDEAMSRFVDCMKSEALSLVDLLTADRLMILQEEQTLTGAGEEFSLCLAADSLILKESGVTDEKRLENVENGQFLKMVLSYLGENQKRIYILAETQKEAQEACDYLRKSQDGIQVCGLAEIHPDFQADDMVINAINSSEVDCVLLLMPSPLLEEFMLDAKQKINARVCLGLGENMLIGKDGVLNKIHRFTLSRVFKSKTKTEKNVYC